MSLYRVFYNLLVVFHHSILKLHFFQFCAKDARPKCAVLSVGTHLEAQQAELTTKRWCGEHISNCLNIQQEKH